MTRTNGPRASEQERKERRRAANRKSARKSRYRENVLMDELQKTVTDLAKHNQSLKSENDDFRQEILALQSLMACHAKAQQVKPKKLTPVLSYQSAFTDLPIDLSAAPREVSRTPSPVESFNLNQLNPDRIFPAQGEINQETNNMSMQSAEQLFRVALFSAATAAV